MKNIKLKEVNLLEIIVLLSPIIDLITSLIVRQLNFTITLGMIIRFVFLIYMLYYLFFKSNSQYKKKSIIYVLIIFSFCFIHLINMYFLKGLIILLSEIKIMFKVFYFPLLFIIFLNYLDDKKNKVDKDLFLKVSLIYLSLIFIPYITKTAFITYSNGKRGCVGWFFAGNEIGAILTILSPFVIYKIMKEYSKWYIYIFLAFYSFIMLLIGTKVPFLGLLLSILLYLFVNIIRFIINKEKRPSLLSFFKIPIIIPIILSLCIVLFIYKNSSLQLNMIHHKNNLLNQKENGEVLGKDDYKNLIFSSRDKFYNTMQKKFKLAHIKEQWLGMGYNDIDQLFNRPYNIIEVDYGDVFYLYGIIGFIIYYSALTMVLLYIVKNLFKNFNNIIFNEDVMPYLVSVSLIMGIAFFAGHVFTAPAVSLFPAVIISSLFLKINKEK